MERDGYESDENHLMACYLLTGEQIFLSKRLNTNVDSYYWKDDKTLVFSAVWHATAMLYEINLQGKRTCLTTGQYDYVPAANIGDTYYCLRHSMREANEIYRFKKGEEPVQISRENDNIYSQITMGNVVPRWQKNYRWKRDAHMDHLSSSLRSQQEVSYSALLRRWSTITCEPVLEFPLELHDDVRQ
jgi:hypothetical protein